MSKHTLEQVLEALINKEDDRASELLHQFFVAKGKQIYEELSSLDEVVEESDEEEVEESIGGSQAEDFEEEIIATEEDLEDEQLFSEDEDMGDEDPMAAEEPGEEEATAELAMDVDMGDEEAGEEETKDAEEAMANVEDALADLKAAFAEIMGEPAAEDMGAEEEVEEEFDALGESASLSAVAAPTHGDDGENTKSPVSSGAKVDNGASAVKVNSGNTAGGKADAPKEDNAGNINVPGGKASKAMKSVAVPKNSDSASNKTSPVAKG